MKEALIVYLYIELACAVLLILIFIEAIIYEKKHGLKIKDPLDYGEMKNEFWRGFP